MAKIALELQRALAQRALHGEAGQVRPRLLAQGDGWSVADVLCTSGPQDRPFEERHAHVAIALVAAGSFQYRGATGPELMSPGSLLLGNAGQCFECGHAHGAGDRCLALRYAPEYFARLAADVGYATPRFRRGRLPPLPALAPLAARACAGLAGMPGMPWEELAVQLAAQTLQLLGGLAPDPRRAPAGAEARVSRSLQRIERDPAGALGLTGLAQEAGLSPYHFLRTFQRLTGVTPHQYILRARLREAALRLATEPAHILDIALDCGFGDLSNFNRAFRTEFALSPRRYRLHLRGRA